MSLNEIDEKRETISKYLTSLNRSHNSQLPINKVIPDILYHIFSFAVFGSSVPATTSLYISHVCHHWRISSLEWGTLWGFLDFSSRKISALFLKRSKDAPITLAWSTRYHRPLFNRLIPGHTNFDHSMKKYFESSVYLFPRLSSLILHLSFSEFKEVHESFQNSGPLRLQSLDIGIYHIPIDPHDPNTIWFQYLLADMTYLRELKLRELSLPWIIPPHQKLTHLSIIHPRILPTSAQLLTFLSHCPALVELELNLINDNPRDLQTTAAQQNQNVPELVEFDKLDFPNLTKLDFCATDSSSYKCIQEVSSHFGNLGTLSSFWVKYEVMPPMETPPTDIFELVPNGALSNFRHQRFLSINLHRSTGNFLILGGDDSACIPRVRRKGHYPIHQNLKFFPLSLIGHGQPGQLFDHSPIIDLIHEMPEIRHLHLISSGWELLTSWDIHLSTIFPHLVTLDLSDQHHPTRDCDDCLRALADSSGLNLKTLILKRVRFDSSLLPHVALKTGIKVLELADDCFVEPEILDILRERGVRVVSFDEELSTISGI
ncbi:hypothetical protein Clacol_005012 [Clathrus columnatus]|uniref:F-box domain-containing protein n=1 Tax=Clathrus columnatus TaxID=1419009 RepID=A0AAV5A840_9AGAM|nr:hypothetical protein Clacol_005012 [Clathrus columnatus]